MRALVNGVEMRVVENVFDEDYGGLGPAISIIATAPNGSEQECYWWYSETEKGSGVFEFSDEAFDSANTGHEDFCDWLQEQTGCDEEEAVEAMELIIESIDTSDQYADEEGELFELYLQNTTESVLEAGTMVLDVSAKIFITDAGRYIGVIHERGDRQSIAELTGEEYKAIEKTAGLHEFGSYERWEAIRNAIAEAAGI
jgi:hypothetical protein